MAALFFNETSKSFVRSETDQSAADVESFFASDLLPIELFFLKTNNNYTQSFVDRSQDSITLAVGTLSPRAVLAAATAFSNFPTSITASLTVAVTGGTGTNEVQVLEFTPPVETGTYSLTFPSRTISLTGSITAGGLFTTSGPHGLTINEPFIISGVSTPSGFVNGDVLYPVFIVSRSSFYAAPAVVAEGEGVAFLNYAGTPSGGTITTLAATTLPIEANSLSIALETALHGLASIGVGQVNVTGTQGKKYFITFTGDKRELDMPLLAINQNTLTIVPRPGKTGTLNLNTTEVLAAITGRTDIDAFVEIEAKQGGTSVETLCQIPIKLRADIITDTSVPLNLVASSFTLIDSNDDAWSVSIDEDGLLTTTKI